MRWQNALRPFATVETSKSRRTAGNGNPRKRGPRFLCQMSPCLRVCCSLWRLDHSPWKKIWKSQLLKRFSDLETIVTNWAETNLCECLIDTPPAVTKQLNNKGPTTVTWALILSLESQERDVWPVSGSSSRPWHTLMKVYLFFTAVRTD